MITAVLVFTPIVGELAERSIGFIIVCLLTLVMGTANIIAQTSAFGLASMLPEKYTGGIMLGYGLAGLCISCIRLVCLGVFPQNSSGYLRGALIYFFISGGMLIFCMFALLHLVKNPLVIEGVNKTKAKEKSQLSGTGEQELSLTDDFKEKQVTAHELSIFNLIKQIWQYLFLVTITYFITFGMISHVALATKAT